MTNPVEIMCLAFSFPKTSVVKSVKRKMRGKVRDPAGRLIPKKVKSLMVIKLVTMTKTENRVVAKL